MGYSNRAIARALDRPHSTINNEIKRRTIAQKRIINDKEAYHTRYDAYATQGLYELNRKRFVKPFKLARVNEVIEFVVDKIRNHKWSPDAVVGYVYVRGLFIKEEMVSTKTLYNYIEQKLIGLDNFDLLLEISHKSSKQVPKKNIRILGKFISSKSNHINDRSQSGHWEIDTVIGVKDLNEPVFLTLTERMTRYKLIIKIDGKTNQAVFSALEPLMNTEHALEIFKSITSDNGSEFAILTEAVKSVAEAYFTHPYSSWERGINEHHNGMIRRFIPKGMRISRVCSKQIRNINLWMNKYPRKILGYHTPHQQFIEQTKHLQMT